MHISPAENLPQNRSERYPVIRAGLIALLEGETDPVACMANAAALLFTSLGYHWVGFYRVMGSELVLGPFQGPVACTRIGYGKGVCGTAWKENRSLRVPDVDAFPGHIACSSLSRSELVIPLRDRLNQVQAVLDIDSALLDDFSDTDQRELELLAAELEKVLFA